MKGKFIRLDMAGCWRGVEHRSTFAMDPAYWGDETIWEDGISCYELDNIPFALESLRHYWEETASMHGNYEQPVKMQVTVFAGERILGTAGFENETMAICEETIMEFPAQRFMSEIIEAESEHVAFLQDPLDVEEYRKELLKIAERYGLL